MFKMIALILVFALPVSVCLAQEYQPLSQYEPNTSLYNPEIVARYSSYSLDFYTADYAEGETWKVVLMALLLGGLLIGLFVVGTAAR